MYHGSRPDYSQTIGTHSGTGRNGRAGAKKRLLLIILGPAVSLLLLIALILYILTSPLSIFAEWVMGDELTAIKDLQINYGYNQNIGIYEQDYIEGSGQSYEGVVFTDGGMEVVYYNQLDERFGGQDVMAPPAPSERRLRSHCYVNRHIHPDRRAARPGGVVQLVCGEWTTLRRERFLPQPDTGRCRRVWIILRGGFVGTGYCGCAFIRQAGSGNYEQAFTPAGILSSCGVLLKEKILLLTLPATSVASRSGDSSLL